jgi:Tol biopolymer transport system component
MQTARQIREEKWREQTLVQVVAGFMKQNEPKQARELADSIGLPQWRGWAWLEIGKAYVRAGGKEQAALAMRRTLHEAQQADITEANGYVGLYLYAYLARAQAAAGLGDEARAWIAATSSGLVKAYSLLGLAKGLAQPSRALEPLKIGYQYEKDDEPFTGKVMLVSAHPNADEAELRALLENRKKLHDEPTFARWRFGPNATFRGKLVLFSCARCRDAAGRLILSMAPDGSAIEVILELTKGQNIEAGRVSRDGRSLAYSVRPAKDAPLEIWVLEATGRHRKVGTDGLVQAWSPDGKQLACYRGTEMYHWQNFLLDVATGREERFAIPPSDLVDDWSPDGQWLAVMAGNPGKTFEHPTKGTYPQRRIYLLHPDGSGRRDLRVGPLPVDNIQARFSPDGKKLLWHQRTHDGLKVLYAAAIHDLDTNESAREILQFNSFFRGNKQFKSAGSPCWSPDGKQTVWLVPRELLEESTSMPELVFVPSAGESAKRLTLRDKGLRIVRVGDWR